MALCLTAYAVTPMNINWTRIYGPSFLIILTVELSFPVIVDRENSLIKAF